jgi:AcrR family transcriptional regulator
MVKDALDAPPVPRHRRAEQRALDAAKRCCERWGVARVRVDDIAAEAGMSRATLYRLFPGGKDVLFEALRVRELTEFLDELSAHIADVEKLDELIVRAVVYATQEMRDDPHLALMMASAPGEVLANFTVDGLPRILRLTTEHLLAFVEPHIGRAEAVTLLEVVTRLVISCFFGPSELVDFGDETSARAFLTHLLPRVFVPGTPELTHPGGPS